ncbi:MAG: hypothetical protein HY319_16950 [Armatimonadetes bacterium]|nr:hypothetical protein [Armatimonadota bacterium]
MAPDISFGTGVAPITGVPSLPRFFAPVSPIADVVSLSSSSDREMADLFRQMRELKEMALRNRMVNDTLANTSWTPPVIGLNPMSMLPSNWDTMPLGDFFDRMTQINQAARADRPKKKNEGGGDGGGGTAALNVNAHRYYNNERGEYVNVAKVQIHEKGAYGAQGQRKRVTDWNQGGAYQFSTGKDNAEVGKSYQVTVTWEDGTSRTWDYTVDSPQGSTVDVYHPWS